MDGDLGYHEAVAEQIFKRMRESKEILLSPSAHEDLLQISYNAHKSDIVLAHELNVHARKALATALQMSDKPDLLYGVYKRSLLMDAPNFFEEYMLYMESDRPIEERFYQTRRTQLKPIVDAIQALSDDELDEVAASLPPRVGKTTLFQFLVSQRMGKYPTKPNLYCSYSDTITRAFYNGVLEIMTDSDTYKYADVFPNATDLKTNAAEETIDVGMKHHYPTLTCRSIDGTLNGACDVDGGFLLADDLVSGIEEAMNKDRLAKLQNKVANNLLSRAKGTTKIAWIGTRWSLFDPIGLRIDLLQNGIKAGDRRYIIINIPALDENDESNFDYPHKKGFSTKDYHLIRENFELRGETASWQAQYMNEPIERDGALFTAPEFNYYMGVLPQQAPDRVFMTVDPAFGGGDFVAGPVCYQYGNKAYVHDVIYNNGDKRVTIPSIVAKAMEFGVTVIQVECNKSTASYAEDLQKELMQMGSKCYVRTKSAAGQAAKSDRIQGEAPDIRTNFYFRSAPQRTKEYNLFMKNVFKYSPFLNKGGLKKQHDDAPDSLAMASVFLKEEARTFIIFQRPC